MILWMRINSILTHRRMTYAWIAGAILWSAWLISIVLGPGKMDLAGQVIGTDYLQFYSAGLTIRQGNAAELYNFEYQSQLEKTIAGSDLQNFHAFLNPPFFAWLYLPLTFLPYTWSFFLWSVLSLGFLWFSIKLLAIEHHSHTLVWSLTWFPVFAAISFGQNSFLSLVLFSLTFWLWKKDKPLTAGLVSGLLLFKPQLILGLGILWLFEWRNSWKSLLGLAFSGTILAGLCFWLLPEASLEYFNLVRSFLPKMMYQDQFPIWHMDSLRSFWILLFPGQHTLVEVLSLLLSIAGIVAFFYFWRAKRDSRDLVFAGAICLTIWITPHAMIYDWSILLIPAILIWQVLPNFRAMWKPLFAFLWTATFLSGPLAFEMLKVLPVAVQISVPVFFYVLLMIMKSISISFSREWQDIE